VSDSSPSITFVDSNSLVIYFISCNQLPYIDYTFSISSESTIKKLIQNNDTLISKILCKLASREDRSGTNALQCLVHLSSSGSRIHQSIEEMMEGNAISRMIEIAITSRSSYSRKNSNQIESPWNKRVNFALALLANLTRTEKGSHQICKKCLCEENFQIGDNVYSIKEDKLLPKTTMTFLLSRFLSDAYLIKTTEKGILSSDSPNDPYQHLAAILMNITLVEQGRLFLLKKYNVTEKGKQYETTSVLSYLLPQLKSRNPIRRKGIAGCIKNCCHDEDSIWWLLHELDLIQHLLYPLTGPEELTLEEKHGMNPDLWLEGSDKKRESDETTRLLLVQAILLLCKCGRNSKNWIKTQRGEVILTIANMTEESEQVSDSIEECLKYLQTDEEETLTVDMNFLNVNNLLDIPSHHLIEEKYDSID